MLDYMEWRNKLIIDKNDLDNACSKQQHSVSKVGAEAARLASVRDQLKDDLKAISGRRSRELREKMAARDGRAPSEAKVEAALMADKDRRAAMARFIEAEEEAAKWDVLKEAWIGRQWMLQTMAKLFLGAYYADVSIEGSSAQMKEAEADKNRREIAKMRRRDAD